MLIYHRSVMEDLKTFLFSWYRCTCIGCLLSHNQGVMQNKRGINHNSNSLGTEMGCWRTLRTMNFCVQLFFLKLRIQSTPTCFWIDEVLLCLHLCYLFIQPGQPIPSPQCEEGMDVDGSDLSSARSASPVPPIESENALVDSRRVRTIPLCARCNLLLQHL